MSLDLVILGEDGSPKQTVQIGIDSHCVLIKLAEQFGLPLFKRLADYYADAVIDSGELSEFLKEIERLQLATPEEAVLRTVLQEAKSLCEQAIAEGTSIEAVAD